jgi:pyridoxine 5-phosphate synthase
MTRLSVNLNKIALLRNTRPLGIPSVTAFALIALDVGAHGITVHPRPDGRHIRPHDVYELSELLKSHPEIELNIEGNPFENALDLVRAVRPHQFTMVPDDPGASTSDHGWDLARDGKRLEPLVREVKALGVRVSLFMDAEADMSQAARVGADRVELYTEPYDLPRFLSAVPGVLEVSIGHALTADALMDGFATTVRNYLTATGNST